MNTELKMTDAQWKAIRFLSRSQYHDRNVAGYGMAPMISACRALVRKGLAYSYKTGKFGLTDAGKAQVDDAMKRMPPKAPTK